MTALAEDLDLSWVTFTDQQPEEPCNGPSRQPCPKEAVAVATWGKACGHRAWPTRHCAAHRDYLLTCTDEFTCSTCDAPAWMVRMEPIR